MATGMDRLERNFDRLEKFFKKRKPSSFRESLAAPDRKSIIQPTFVDAPSLEQQTFPSPSFIRPTSTRMLARDEVIPCTARQSRRATSLPEPPTVPERRRSDEAPASPYLNILDQFPKIPQRSSSLRQSSFRPLSLRDRSGTASLAELLNYSVPEDLSMSSDTLIGSSRSAFGLRRRSDSPRPTARQQGEKPQSVPSTALADSVYTPPPSAHEEKFPPIQAHNHDAHPKNPSSLGNPTPESSPKLFPAVTRDHPKDTSGGGATRVSRPKSLDSNVSGRPKVTMLSLRKTVSDSTLSATASSGQADDGLREPSLKDFMALSDDDIAGDCLETPEAPVLRQEPTTPPSCSLPPDPPQAASPNGKEIIRHSRIPSEAALASVVALPTPVPQPPVIRAPAAVAAFEAARIATRYRFDLVYVVNLWPSNTGCSHPRTTSGKPSMSSLPTPVSSGPSLASPINSLRSLQALHKCLEGQGSVANIKPPGGMNGRILAAYGLPSVLSPFRISAPVHQKVLRADGWLEYRSDAPALDEFARGYSCAFYPGYTPDGRWRPVDTDVERERTGSPEERSKRRTDKLANRGIVFAAYRLPNPDGTVLGSDVTELEKLHQDARMLVETLIDIHMMQRQKDMGGEVEIAQLVRSNLRQRILEEEVLLPNTALATQTSPLLAT